ncbi:hypothetical protein V6N12_012873 [Hibiscus sabdariffa]|uniref:Reverse transcriptase Ty1/copia-type domain-containing protein n=1 Tax=Hibiscus sabdariffa TaxID=183260 RepID=A0ABR2EHA4_9ROSI
MESPNPKKEKCIETQRRKNALKPKGEISKEGKYFHCDKLGHWKGNCPVYLEEVKKAKAVRVSTFDQDKPKTYQEAVWSPDSEKWLEAMRSEMDFMSEKPNYDETFSPVAMFKSIRILLAIAAFHDYEIWQMDVKTAFLNGK